MSVLRTSIRLVVALAFALVAGGTLAQQQPDAARLLADVKEATGGAAWDSLRTQHSVVSFRAGQLAGNVERWASIATGRSVLQYEIGALTGMQGFDGLYAWSQDANGVAHVESDADTRELAANAAYRDRLAFWFPERQSARIEYARRDSADGIDYDVIRIAPDGGRAYEVWVAMLTHRIERLVERENAHTRTEIYRDFRRVQGVTLPFRVRISRGDAQHEEEYAVETIEYNVSLDGVDFGVPPPPPDDVAFASGKDTVDVPFVVRNGHVFVDVKLNGKGPFRMLFDAGGANVLLPAVAKTLGLKPEHPVDNKELAVATVSRVDIEGVALERQPFAVIDLASLMRRVEGVDDVAGIFGFELLKRMPAKIDYAHTKLVLYRARPFRPPVAAARVPFEWHERTPRVHASVDGIDGTFDIDTGSRASLTLAAPFVERNDLVRKYGAVRDVVAGAGAAGRSHALLARSGRLSLGGIDIAAPVTYLSTAESGALADPALAGNIGYGVLRRFDVTFDYAHRLLYFEKNASFGDADVHDRAGLWLERSDRGFEIVDVVRDSPAQAAGLATGDVVTAVDGKPAKSIALSDVRALLRAAPGTKVRLAIARKSKGATDATVVLRDLI